MTPEDEQRALRAHCRMMIDFMVKGYLIPFFGAGVNLANRPPGASFLRGEYLPNAAELSDSIATQFDYPWSDKDLLRVSWHASAKYGEGYLYQHLHDIFSLEYPLTDVHKFFARLPAKLAAKGYPNRHQLIVTTNYDELLERSFDEESEPYDLLHYVAHSDSEDGREVGKFRYVPHDGDPEIIFDPNKFDLSIERTIILKIHGAVDRKDWQRGNFVITEDDYIDYLARMNTDPYKIPAVLNLEMLHKRFLFLGYSLADWNLRVLLKSINARRRFKDTSWAVMNETKEWDETYWQKHNVRLMKLSLSDYVAGLDKQLDAYPRSPEGYPYG
jgi:hypothetical protein